MTTGAEGAPRDAKQPSRFDSFVRVIGEWLENLGINSRIFVEMTGDEELPLPVRTLAAGVLLYLHLPIDLIPDKLKLLGLLDDAIVMIVGLSIIVPMLPDDRLDYYGQKYEAVRTIDERVEPLRLALGMLWEKLVEFVGNLRSRTYRGKTTEEVVRSPALREELLDDTMRFIAELDLRPDTLDKALPSPEKVMGLLASGIEEEQERKDPENTIADRSRSALKRMLPGNKEA
jgi:uncharacterized membrane protein YkvA (DUF1232 family)